MVIEIVAVATGQADGYCEGVAGRRLALLGPGGTVPNIFLTFMALFAKHHKHQEDAG